MESGIADVLQHLSSLRLTHPRGVRDIMFTRGEVDALLSTSYHLRGLAPTVSDGSRKSDVAIDIVRSRDGSEVVLPASAVA